jgi:RimJ/RimL family protein N-acetyltransferase
MKKKTAKAKAPAFYAKSKRLAFRLLAPADEGLYCELFTDATTMRYVYAPFSPERAARSFKKALEVTQRKPFQQHISVIVERATRKPIGISSLRLVDADCRRAEGGMLLKPTAHAQKFAREGTLALIDEAFKWHPIEELTAEVAKGHQAAERLVASSGYAKGADVAASEGRLARSTWSITRTTWARNYKPATK